MLLTDVVVVGGGPAGAAAAIQLARDGRDVTVVDRALFPRDKCCGDGLTTGALRLLEDLGLDPVDVDSWQRVDDFVVRSPSGREVTFSLPQGAGAYAAVARRRDLDAALLDVARQASVNVLDGHACVGVAMQTDRVTVDVEGVGPVSSRYVVAADGVWSPVRKHLGIAVPGYRGEWHAFRQYFSDVDAAAGRDLFVWFEPDLLPGYAWSFPLPGNRANVGFGIQRGGQLLHLRDMASLWRDLLTRPHVREVLGARARPEAPHRAWPIPARVDEITLTAGRALFVGDAAAACDPMTGEGIGQALLTGMLAAAAITGAGPHDARDAATRYERAARAALVADHRMSMLLIRALRREWGARAALRAAGSTAWTRRNFARWLFEDYPRAVAVTPRRWHRQGLSGPGAYRQATTPTP